MWILTSVRGDRASYVKSLSDVIPLMCEKWNCKAGLYIGPCKGALYVWANAANYVVNGSMPSHAVAKLTKIVIEALEPLEV